MGEVAIGYLEKFKEQFNMGIKSIENAAKIYVEALDADVNAYNVFRDAFDGEIPASAWTKFENVGRGFMHSKLLIGAGGRHSNKIAKLPMSEQKLMFDGKVDLLLQDGDTIKVDAKTLRPSDAKQLFANNHIRSLSEQKTYLESIKAEHSLKMEEYKTLPYEIKGNKIFFKHNTEFTKRELKKLIEGL
jgi:hypothetical protein